MAKITIEFMDADETHYKVEFLIRNNRNGIQQIWPAGKKLG